MFIHGFLDSHATWAPLVKALPQHAAQSIALDPRGAGNRQAHAGPYTLNQALMDVLELLDEKKFMNVALIGRAPRSPDSSHGRCTGDDRRAKQAVITKAGVARYRKALPLWSDVQAKFEGTYGEKPAAELRHALRTVLGTGFQPWAENESTVSV